MTAATMGLSRTNERKLNIEREAGYKAIQTADSKQVMEIAGKPRTVPMFCPLHQRVIDERGDIVIVRFPRRGGKDYTVAAKVVIDRLKGLSPRDCSYVTLDKRRAVEWIGYVTQILKRFGVILEVIGYTEIAEESEYFVAEVRMPIPGMDHEVTIRALASPADGVRGRDGDVGCSEAAFQGAREAPRRRAALHPERRPDHLGLYGEPRRRLRPRA